MGPVEFVRVGGGGHPGVRAGGRGLGAGGVVGAARARLCLGGGLCRRVVRGSGTLRRSVCARAVWGCCWARERVRVCVCV